LKKNLLPFIEIKYRRKSLLVIVLSCPLIGSLSSSTANQRAAQNNYCIEPDFGVSGFEVPKLKSFSEAFIASKHVLFVSILDIL
jgi:hypothetical protein